MSLAYYNEIDPVAAQWLRNLIAAGHIAPGWVDERSIEDVKPWEIEPFTQCHFFAGVGVWSLSLRRAGWPDDRPIWTGSCPCQPFSAAGKSGGFTDERHLWPHFYWLIEQRRPAVVAGEQVASKAAEPWLDLVQTDLEALGYAFGAVAFPSAGVGAPHIRDRAYWVGYANNERLEGYPRNDCKTRREGEGGPVAATGVLSGVADRNSDRCEAGGERRETLGHGAPVKPDCGAFGVADNAGDGRREQCADVERGREGSGAEELEQRPWGDGVLGSSRPAGPTNGYWANADWLFCRDGKWRPVEPGTLPLAYGAPARVGRLRAYGNAINAEAATVFIDVVKELVE